MNAFLARPPQRHFWTFLTRTNTLGSVLIVILYKFIAEVLKLWEPKVGLTRDNVSVAIDARKQLCRLVGLKDEPKRSVSLENQFQQLYIFKSVRFAVHVQRFLLKRYGPLYTHHSRFWRARIKYYEFNGDNEN